MNIEDIIWRGWVFWLNAALISRTVVVVGTPRVVVQALCSNDRYRIITFATYSRVLNNDSAIFLRIHLNFGGIGFCGGFFRVDLISFVMGSLKRDSRVLVQNIKF